MGLCSVGSALGVRHIVGVKLSGTRVQFWSGSCKSKTHKVCACPNLAIKAQQHSVIDCQF